MSTYPDMWTVRVAGTPAPQGSRVAMPSGGSRESAAGIGLWRHDILTACRDQLTADRVDETDLPLYPSGVPLDVAITFYLPPPQTAVKQLTRGIPTFPSGKPDEDKLRRGVLDACTLAGVWADDAQIVGANDDCGGTRKRWAWHTAPGAWVEVRPVVVDLVVVPLWTWTSKTPRRHWRALGNRLFTLCGKDMATITAVHLDEVGAASTTTTCAACDKTQSNLPAWVRVKES